MPWERPKTSSTRRGYGTGHKAERARYARAIERGQVVLCHFCGQPIRRARKGWPGDRGYLHLDHSEDRQTYRGPAHSGCNVSDGARRGRARQVDGESSTPAPRTSWRSRVW